MKATENRFTGLVNGFVAAAGDADDRHASINQYLCNVFADITPADLTDAETTAVAEALEPAFLRVTGTTVNQGAPAIPRAHQLQEILARVAPRDLSATEAILVLTLLMPIHSRVITARADGHTGRPLQRLLLDSLE
ncbi:MAG: hypothetical protein ACOYEV_18335 [Candidatus Nanopelagicales bacterium]